MYTTADPRSNLAASKGGAETGKGFAASEYARFYATQPDEQGEGTRTWYARGQNFIVAYTDAEPGAVLRRPDQVDEYVALVHDPETPIAVTAPGEHLELAGASLTIVPPGPSTITLPKGGKIVRMITTRAADLVAKCSNAAAYAEPHPYIPPFQPWPDPPEGFRVRNYSLDVPDQPGRFGRLWRCTTFMINVFAPAPPRDPRQLSPHHHDDFEQCSLAVGGGFMHHLRWPWTTDLYDWREDEHEYCGSPSMVVIPPRAIHTSAAADETEPNLLVDIFSPPRADFSKMDGWVLNAAEYPTP